MKASFVTWQLRQLHEELDAIDQQRSDTETPVSTGSTLVGREVSRDRAAQRAVLDRMLRSLPRRLGFRDARTFIQAFVRATEVDAGPESRRRRLTPSQVQELERRVLNNERPADIARAIGCAQQTVLNRSTQLRKRLSMLAEQDASGI